ncbi:uncharacterized protein LOC117657678 [Pantherophis guttatus]|uniref:Uncharacterized protein LOC117657678 n=1 Tax=Pantherophis guttatus TaxID=94885 RepID=A0A6P9AT20_PANGU|nr:uncharacterized protein LOC117657678 [Pantherophis guttatus]
MRSSLVGLQLLLACVLVWGTSVAEEKKECCGPGVPPEKSCCPKGNSTSQEPEKEEEQQVVPEEPNSEEPKRQGKKLRVREEPTSEELEERAKRHREIMQQDSRSIYESMFLKQQALDYFNKHKTAFYRPIEDTDVKVKSATGTIVTFTQFLVKTNCTKEEGRKFSIPWYELPSTESVPCVALPKHEQKVRCTAQNICVAYCQECPPR